MQRSLHFEERNPRFNLCYLIEGPKSKIQHLHANPNVFQNLLSSSRHMRTLGQMSRHNFLSKVLHATVDMRSISAASEACSPKRTKRSFQTRKENRKKTGNGSLPYIQHTKVLHSRVTPSVSLQSWDLYVTVCLISPATAECIAHLRSALGTVYRNQRSAGKLSTEKQVHV